MHLLIDLQSCQSGSRLGGIGRYSLDLAKGMARHFNGDRLSILLNDKNTAGEATVRREFRHLVSQADIHVFPQPENCRYIHDDGILASDAAAIRNRVIRDLNPDFVHVSSLLEGFLEDITTTIDPGMPWMSAVTVYDLIPLKQPDTYLRDDRARSHYLDKVSQFANADVLLGISDFSTREILDHLPEFKGVARNILGGIDPRFQPNPHARVQYGDAFEQMGIKRSFILYTASFDLRKNQKGLIEAFAKLPSKLRAAHQLVLVGNGWPNVYDALLAHARAHGIDDDTIVFPGHVSDEILAALYCACELFVFPSLWEGLGMPVLEAMASGAPCIGSNTTSVPEVLGLAEASFDPTDPGEIAAIMRRALTDGAFRERLKEHGREHSSKFSWDASAVEALDAIQSLTPGNVKKSKTPRNSIGALKKPATTALPDLNELSIAEAKRQLLADDKAHLEMLRVGWLTTWEKRCGVAMYSKNLLEDFVLPVTVLRQHSEDREPFQLARKIPTVSCWEEGKEASLDQLREAVADLDLTDLVIQFNYGLFNFDQLNALLVQLPRKGVNVHIDLHSTRDPFDLQGHRLIELVDGLRSCASVFVHSDADVQRLAALRITENVRVMPLGIRRVNLGSPAAADKCQSREIIVGSYGFFLPSKGLLELIQSARVLNDDGLNIKLRLVNACYEDPRGISRALIAEARELAETLDVSGQVEFHTDYLSDEESAVLLSKCDLIAFPYQDTGESASAAIRMALAIGRPILTTPLPIFDDVKDLVFQTTGCLATDIAAGIKYVSSELNAKDGRVQELRERVAKRIAVYDYSGLSLYLAREIAAYSLCARQVSKFTASPSNVSPVQSAWAGDRWVARSPGLMLHGPYIRLDPGVYAISIDYRLANDAAGELPTVRVTADNREKTLFEFALESQSEIASAATRFHVCESHSNVEVIVMSGDPAALEIFGYEIIQTVV